MTPLLCDVMIQTSFLDSSRRILCNNFQLWQAWMISSFLVTFLILPVVHYHLQKQSGLLFPMRKRAKQIPRVGSMPLSDFLSLGGPWVRVTLPPPAHARQGHRRWVLKAFRCPWSHIQTFWTGWPAGLQCRHSWSPEGHSKWCPSQVFPSPASVHCTVSAAPFPSPLMWGSSEDSTECATLSGTSISSTSQPSHCNWPTQSQLAYQQCPFFSVARTKFAIKHLSIHWAFPGLPSLFHGQFSNWQKANRRYSREIVLMRSEAKLEFLAILHFFISCCARRRNFQKTGMLPDVYDSLVIVLACERVCWFITHHFSIPTTLTTCCIHFSLPA